MDNEKECEIRKFFQLTKRIQVIKNRIDYLEREFYNQTFTPQTIVIESVEIIRAGFKMESEVSKHVDTINDLEKSIERLSKMKSYFDKYFMDLPADTRSFFINKYINNVYISVDIKNHETKLYEEIEEIYTAINFMYGYPQEKGETIKDLETGNKKKDISKMLGMLSV